MKEIVYNKIKDRLIYIQNICFDLNLLEFQFFILNFSKNITTTSNKEVLLKRLENDYIFHQISKASIIDKYFLEFAKLFEKYSRNEVMSFPTLDEVIRKNPTFTNKSDFNNILTILNKANSRLENYKNTIVKIINHRDNCLGHNSKRKIKCDHLDGLSSIETRKIILIITEFTDDLSVFFEYDKFQYKKLEKIKDELSKANYERIRSIENNIT